MGSGESTPRKVVVENPDANVEKVPVTSAVSKAVSEVPGESSSREKSGSNVDFDKTRHAQYEDKIKALELKNENLLQEKLSDFSKTLKRVEDKYLQSTCPLVCADVQAEVNKCYSEHSTETLKCAASVNKFYECTRKYQSLIKGH